MASTTHRGPDQAGIADLRTSRHASRHEDLDTDALQGAILGHLRLAITGQEGTQPLHDCNRRFMAACNGEIWNHLDLRRQLEPEHSLAHDSDAAIVPHVIEEHLTKDATLTDALEAALERIDGEYAIAAVDDRTTVLARDPLGVKPLYYAHNEDGYAFASEQKALWDLGYAARRVPPNSIVTLTPDGVRTRSNLEAIEPDQEEAATPGDAFRVYKKAVEEAMRKRVRGVEEAVVVLSGGVDSALVAAAANRLGQDITCWVAGTPGSPDVEAAKQTAEAMGLELRVAEFDPDDVASWFEELLRATEARNQLHVETALPLFAVCQAAGEEGFRVLLTGQGADELMAGYAWYPRVLAEEGEPGLRGRMRQDRDLLFKETLEREDRVSMTHSVELRVPFLDPAVVRAAERVPLRFLLDDGDDTMGKRLHRELAEAWGVPSTIAWRPKEAAQHGSGSRGILKEAAKRAEPSKAPSGYAPSERLSEVGSSQRYGHAYMDEATKWRIDVDLQWRLDRIAARCNAVAPEEQAALRERVDARMSMGEP